MARSRPPPLLPCPSPFSTLPGKLYFLFASHAHVKEPEVMSAAVRHVSRLDRPFAGIEQSLDEVRTEWVCVGGGLWFPIVRIRLCEGERGGRHAIDIALLCDPHTQTHTHKHTHTHTHTLT